MIDDIDLSEKLIINSPQEVLGLNFFYEKEEIQYLPEIGNSLVRLYNDKSKLNNALGVLTSSIVKQGNLYFTFSLRSLSSLCEKAFGKKILYPASYTKFVDKILGLGFVELVYPPTWITPGIYKILDPQVVGALKAICNIDLEEEERKKDLLFAKFDNLNLKRQLNIKQSGGSTAVFNQLLDNLSPEMKEKLERLRIKNKEESSDEF